MNAGYAYRQLAAHDPSPLHLVVVLYEQLIKDLRGSLSALEKGNIEERTREIDHALMVVGQLQGTLDMEEGGEIAHNLQRFYDLLRFSLLAAQVSGRKEVLHKQISNLLVLREAWAALEGMEPSPATTSAPPPAVQPKAASSAAWENLDRKI